VSYVLNVDTHTTYRIEGCSALIDELREMNALLRQAEVDDEIIGMGVGALTKVRRMTDSILVQATGGRIEDLEPLAHVGPVTESRLREMGMSTIAAVAASSADEIAELRWVTPEKAEAIVADAQRLLAERQQDMGEVAEVAAGLEII